LDCAQKPEGIAAADEHRIGLSPGLKRIRGAVGAGYLYSESGQDLAHRLAVGVRVTAGIRYEQHVPQPVNIP
jgi:hypothetical protein